MNIFYFVQLLILTLIFSLVGGVCSQKSDSVQISKDSSIEKETTNTSSANKNKKTPEKLSNKTEANKNRPAFDSSLCNYKLIDYKYSGLDSLVNMEFKKSEIEVRLGISGGIGLPHWFIFQKNKKVSPAYLIAPLGQDSDNINEIMKKIKLPRPSSGWKKFNAFLRSEGISLPIKLAESEKYYKDMDGVGAIIIEIKSGTKYDCRWYNYTSKKGQELSDIFRSTAKRFKMTKEFGYSR